MERRTAPHKTLIGVSLALLFFLSACGGIDNFSEIIPHPQIVDDGHVPIYIGPPGGFPLDNTVQAGPFKGYGIAAQRQYLLSTASPEPSIEDFYGDQLKGWKMETSAGADADHGVGLTTYTWSRSGKALMIIAYRCEDKTCMEAYFLKK